MIITRHLVFIMVLLAAAITSAVAQESVTAEPPAPTADANAPADPNAPGVSSKAATPNAAADATDKDASGPVEATRSFGEAASTMQQRLEESRDALNRVRKQISDEKIPLTRELGRLEAELAEIRREHRTKTRERDTRALSVSNLEKEISQRKKEAGFLSNSLLSEYIRNLETRLHIAEMQRYQKQINEAQDAAANENLSEFEVIDVQAEVLALSLQRLEDILGGTRFQGQAIDPEGIVQNGTFLLVGPTALFQSADGQYVGTAERRRGAEQPTIVEFENPETVQAAADIIAGNGNIFPLDPTLGNAHVIAETEDTLWEHIQKGGPVMIPIGILAASAFLVALYKWVGLSFVRTPSQRRINALLDAVGQRDKAQAKAVAQKMNGPAGEMLQVGVEHLDEPRDLIEEIMYEKVLSTRLKLQRFLPFVAITAASAPLLGLLGTVTGIINTFKLITVFGTGDVKTLSGGISEALVTTEFGLIIAIPSLLLHAFLSRKARGVIDQMEKAAVALVNQISKSRQKPVDDAA